MKVSMMQMGTVDCWNEWLKMLQNCGQLIGSWFQNQSRTPSRPAAFQEFTIVKADLTSVTDMNGSVVVGNGGMYLGRSLFACLKLGKRHWAHRVENHYCQRLLLSLACSLWRYSGPATVTCSRLWDQITAALLFLLAPHASISGRSCQDYVLSRQWRSWSGGRWACDP